MVDFTACFRHVSPKCRLLQSSIEVEIIRCASVNVVKTACSKLRSALFKEIPKLTLAAEAFEFKKQGNIGKHGPVTTVSTSRVCKTALRGQQIV